MTQLHLLPMKADLQLEYFYFSIEPQMFSNINCTSFTLFEPLLALATEKNGKAKKMRESEKKNGQFSNFSRLWPRYEIFPRDVPSCFAVPLTFNLVLIN